MYLHLGGDHVVPADAIVAIFPLQAMESTVSREFCQWLKSEGRIVDLSEGRTKSCVLTDEVLYYSPISANTLLKRSEQLLHFDDA